MMSESIWNNAARPQAIVQSGSAPLSVVVSLRFAHCRVEISDIMIAERNIAHISGRFARVMPRMTINLITDDIPQ